MPQQTTPQPTTNPTSRPEVKPGQANKPASFNEGTPHAGDVSQRPTTAHDAQMSGRPGETQWPQPQQQPGPGGDVEKPASYEFNESEVEQPRSSTMDS